MNLIDIFNFIKDDFEIIALLEKVPPNAFTNNVHILKYIQDETYGKDFGAVFRYKGCTYLLYKIGKKDDSGLFVVYVKNQHTKFLKLYIQNASDVFPNGEIRKHLETTLDSLI